MIAEIIEWLISAVNSLGYLGIFIGMTIESSVIPFPAELILPPAGVLVARGQMSFLIVLLLAVAGSIAGALINYYIAYHLGRKAVNKLLLKYGKILFIKESELLKSESYFQKHGEITTFVGRLIPGIRSFVSLPAGFYKMNLSKFCLFTGIGAGAWSAMLIYLGILYGENQETLKPLINQLTAWILLAIAVIIIVYYLIVKKKRKISNYQ